MPLDIANTNALCTLAEAESLLGLTASTTIDERVKRMILAVSDHIERVCGRKFKREAITGEKFAGYGTPVLYVARPPIDTAATIAIKFDGTAIGTDEYVVEDADDGRIYRAGGLAWTAPYVAGAKYAQLPGHEERIWTADYTGGYRLPNIPSGDRDLPFLIENVALQAVVTMYRGAARDQSISSERLLSWNASYRGAYFGMGNIDFDGVLTRAQRESLAPWTRAVQA